MRSKGLSVLLAAAIACGSLPSAVADEPVTTGSGNLAEQIAKAMPETPDNDFGHKLHYGLEIVEGIEVGLAILAIHGAAALVFEIAGPIAGMAAVWVALGNAHADAINSLMRDEMLSGFSRGVVLGADDRPPDYVKANFMKHSPVRNSVYPEYGTKLQKAYNQALASGYVQGRGLLEKKAWRDGFMQDLHARMSVHPSITYGQDQDAWGDRTWRDYYLECAAVFRGTHLE